MCFSQARKDFPCLMINKNSVKILRFVYIVNLSHKIWSSTFHELCFASFYTPGSAVESKKAHNRAMFNVLDITLDPSFLLGLIYAIGQKTLGYGPCRVCLGCWPLPYMVDCINLCTSFMLCSAYTQNYPTLYSLWSTKSIHANFKFLTYLRRRVSDLGDVLTTRKKNKSLILNHGCPLDLWIIMKNTCSFS